MKKVCLITNIPAPYRIPVFDMLEDLLSLQGFRLLVMYLSPLESNRKWKVQNINHSHMFLPVKTVAVKNRYVHINPTLTFELGKYRPDVLIASDFGLSSITSMFWAKIMGVPFVSFSDGNLESEINNGPARKIIRKLFVRNSSAFLGPSRKTVEMYVHYGAKRENCFQSVLCVDNSRYHSNERERRYDLLFAGQLVHRKMPDFVVEVMKKLTPGVSLQIVGDGDMRDWFLDQLTENGVDFKFQGFVQPENIHNFYKNSSILLFPTREDPWGVVANEACAAGLPVITSNRAGVAGELVKHGKNGFVLPCDAGLWGYCIELLLGRVDLYETMSKNAVRAAADYNVPNAATGILNAVLHSLN